MYIYYYYKISCPRYLSNRLIEAGARVKIKKVHTLNTKRKRNIRKWAKVHFWKEISCTTPSNCQFSSQIWRSDKSFSMDPMIKHLQKLEIISDLGFFSVRDLEHHHHHHQDP